jgi:hypothetical protein
MPATSHGPATGRSEKAGRAESTGRNPLHSDVGHGFVGKTAEIARAANDQALARTLKFIDGLFGR